jgi:hypothetical protein
MHYSLFCKLGQYLFDIAIIFKYHFSMEVIAIRMPEELKEALEKAANKERRTISNMARIAIEG